MNATETFLQSLQQKSGARVGSMLTLDQRDPDAVAEQMRVASEIGLPANVIAADPDGFKRQLAQKKNTTALTNAPLTAKWLQDLNNGVLAKDDVDNLSWFEQSMRSYVDMGDAAEATVPGRMAQRGGLRIAANPSQFKAGAAGQVLADQGKTFDDIYGEIIAPYGDDAPASIKVAAQQVAQIRADRAAAADVELTAQSGAEALAESRGIMAQIESLEMSDTSKAFRDGPLKDTPDTLGGLAEAIWTDPVGGAAFIAETFGEFLPTLAASAATTALTRSPAAGTAVLGAGSFLAENASSAQEFLSSKGVDMSTPEAAMAVLNDADLMREAGERGATRGVIIAALDALSGGIAGQALVKNPGGDVLVQSLAQMVLGGGGEALATAAVGDEINWKEVGLEAVGEALTLPFDLVIGGRAIKDIEASATSGKTAAALDELDAMAAKSKLKQRSPEKFQEALEAQGEQDFYVPAEDLREYFQAKDVNFDDETLEAWGIDPMGFAEAEATGGDVAIPRSVYATRISGTDDAAWFRDNATMSADEMSAAQAARFNSEVRETMEKALADAEAQRAAELEVRASDVQVYDSVFTQLREAGRTRDVADNEARVWSSFWRTMGERYGADPLALAQSMGVAIRGPQTPEAARRRNDLDIKLNTLRANPEKALKPSGVDLLTFIRSEGGISDVGGDVEAMDAPKGVIAETRADYEARRGQPNLTGGMSEGRGKGLDDLGRAAIEAGYFPELMGGADIQADGTVVDESAVLLDALQRAISGESIYPVGEGADPDLTALYEQISERGLDLREMSNDEIAAALEETGEREYNQDGTLLTDTPAFRKWFGDSKVVDADGKPLVVYHGTRKDFDAFRPLSWVATEPEMAESYALGGSGETGPQVIASYASISNPFDTDLGLPNSPTWREFAVEAMEQRGDALTQEQVARVEQIISEGEKIYPGAVDKVAFWQENFVTNLESLLSALDYDGLIYREESALNVSDADTERAITYAALSPAQIKSVHNRGTFDGSDPRILYQADGTKRASVVFPRGGLKEGQTVINLFESANLSSFLHESGHFFLEAFTALATSPDAPQAMRDDLAAIHKFLKVEDGASLTTEQHELWARGFEAYAMEGKAPSLELADAFGRFKAWLTRIYASIKGLNVKLNPEIREVMDRMLATDEEIQAARETQQLSPLFTDQAASGMSDAAWSTYQRMARRSEEEASQALLEKTMAKVRREKEKWWKDEHKQVRKEVETTINSKPEYRLIEMLANQTWIGSAQEVPDFQLDRKELVEAFGDGVLAELSRSRFGGKRAIYGAEGVSLHEAADFFGFANPSEMVETLQNTGKRRDAIELETDRIMSDRYGDPLNDGSIEQEALAAIHSEQQAQTVASEIRHLAGQAGKPTRNLTAKVFRQRARMMLGRMSVKEAIRPDAFLAAERKAAKRAEDTFARVARGRDAGAALATAAKHKEQQLLNHYLYLESRDLSKMVASKREKMRDYSKKSVRAKIGGAITNPDGTTSPGYIEQIDALLDGYDFRVRSAGQVQRSENLRQFVERMTKEGRAGELAIDDRLIDEANRKHYTKLSVDELKGLFDTIENIDHMGRFKKKLQDAKDARDMDEVVSGILGEFEANVSGEPPNRTPTAGEARRKLGRDYLNTILNADTLLREVDGFKDLGPTWTALKAKVDAGMNRLTERRVEMAKSFDAIYDVYSAKEKRDMAVKKQNAALGGLFSKWDLISLALNTGNEGNFERLTNPKNKGHFNQNDIEAALSELDERDWRTVQNIWDYIDGFWPEIAAKEKRQTGLAPTKVETKLHVTAPGFVKGGYYPLKYDSRLSGLAADFKQKELAEEIMGGAFGKAQTRNGHTKERGKTATQPVALDLGIAHAHVEQVIYDLEIGEAVNASWKILHDPRIREAFTEKGKQSDFDALEIWLHDVAAGERVAAGGLQSIMRHMRSGFTISRLALNISTALIQPTGLVQSAVLIGKRAVARGTIDYMSNMPRWVNEVTTVSSLMRERKKTFERDIYNVVGDLEGGPVTGRWEKFQRDVILPMSFVMMQTTQFYAVDMPTWVSAYQKEIKASGNEKKAREYADLMVKRAQGSGLMSDRGMLERGTLNAQSRQQEFPRMLTALGSYMFAKGNVFYEKARQVDFKNPVQVMSLAMDIGLLFTFEAVLYNAVKGYLPGEDEDEPLEVAGWLGGETVASMMSTLPLARELSGAVQGFNGGGIFGSAVEVIAKPLIQAAQGDADKAFVKSIIDAGGVALHLPSSQTKAAIEAIFDADMSLNDDISPLKALGLGGGKGRSLADLMFGSE